MAKSSATGVYRISKPVWSAVAKHDRPKVVVRRTFRVLVEGP